MQVVYRLIAGLEPLSIVQGKAENVACVNAMQEPSPKQLNGNSREARNAYQRSRKQQEHPNQAKAPLGRSSGGQTHVEKGGCQPRLNSSIYLGMFPSTNAVGSVATTAAAKLVELRNTKYQSINGCCSA